LQPGRGDYPDPDVLFDGRTQGGAIRDNFLPVAAPVTPACLEAAAVTARPPRLTGKDEGPVAGVV